MKISGLGAAVVHRRRIAMMVTICAALAGLCLVGCGSGSSRSGGSDVTSSASGAAANTVALVDHSPATDAGAKPSGSLTFGTAAPLSSNNLYVDTLTDDVAIWRAWWEYVVRPSRSGKGYDPQLATSWSTSDDGRTYTFHLRNDVKFSNGEPFTAADVLFSWNKAFTTSTSTLTFLKAKISSMTAPNPSTVVVHFKQPWAYFLGEVCCDMAAILPHSLVTKEGYKAYIKDPVGTGPFTYGKVNPGVSVTVNRNPDYWETGYPKLNSITFTSYPDDSARATAVEGGQAQLAESPPPNELSQLASNANLSVDVFNSAQVWNIAFNTKKAPFNNTLIRRAISLAINRDAIVKTGLFGTGQAANTNLVGPSALTEQDTKDDFYPYDPTEAKALIKRSGLKTPVKVTLQISNSTVQSAIGEVVKANLAAVGIEATVKQVDLNTEQNDIGEGDYFSTTDEWGDYQPDPTIQPEFAVNPAYCCDAYFTYYKNASEIAALNRAISATNPTQRRKLFDALQHDMSQAASVIPLFYPELTYVASKNLAGFYAYPNNLYAFEQWQLKK